MNAAVRKAYRQIVSKIIAAIRRLALYSSVLYAFGAIGLILSFRIIGENNPTLGFLLYVPQLVWLLPALLLFFPTLFFHRKAALLYVFTGLIVLKFSMGWQLESSKNARNTPVTVMTYNYGQSGGKSMRPFVDAEKPDMIVMQEVGKRVDRYKESYPEYTVTGIGEFILMSKFPVSATVPPVSISVPSHNAPVAGRFEIEIEGNPVAIYAVHLPTPRGQLLGSGVRTLVSGLIPLPLPGWKERRKESSEYWKNRVSISRELAGLLAQEKLPMLVAGDFNTPHHGYNHRVLFKHLIDSHEARGDGFGFTFPGKTNNPLALGGPWLRIDYVASDTKNWRPLYAKTEPYRESQHRAHVGRFELKKRKD